MIQTKLIPAFVGALSLLLDPRRRFTVKFFADVTNGVMNGDPDRPPTNRVDPYTGHGLATDVSAKRVLRDNFTFLLGNGYEVAPAADDPYTYGQLYVAHRGILNANNEAVYAACKVSGYEAASVGVPEKLVEKLVVDGVQVDLPNPAYALAEKDGKYLLSFDGSLDTEAREAALEGFGKIDRGLKPLVTKLHKGSKTKVLDDLTLVKLNQQLGNMYEDVRQFGAVASTGNSCGNVKGPWQIGYGRSIDPIEAVSNAITRVAVTRIEDAGEKRQEMGRKEPIPYALFEFNATYSPNLASRVGTRGLTAEDLRLFWTALYNFGRFSGSSMRGHIEAFGIYVFVHDHPLGNEHDHRLLARVRAERKPGVEHPRLGDYTVAVNEDDLPPGVTLVKLYERGEPDRTVPAPVPPATK